MKELFWLSKIQFDRIKPYFPLPRGKSRVDDLQVISGIIYVLTNGLLWKDAPPEYGRGKSLYGRFLRWSDMGIMNRIFADLAKEGIPLLGKLIVDAPCMKEQRTGARLLKKGMFPAVPGARGSRDTLQNKNIHTGLYVPVRVDAATRQHVLHDSWMMIPTLFAPCYVGGLSAAEYWGFTDQNFDSVHVFTPKNVGRTMRKYRGTNFVLKKIKAENMFGLKVLRCDNCEVLISNKHRTIVDMLSSPRTGGDIEHVVACLKSYFSDEESDVNQLVANAERLGNGAVFKRLGFLAEGMGMETLAGICRERITTGVSNLDPTILNSRLVRRWNLWVPHGWERY